MVFQEVLRVHFSREIKGYKPIKTETGGVGVGVTVGVGGVTGGGLFAGVDEGEGGLFVVGELMLMVDKTEFYKRDKITVCEGH